MDKGYILAKLQPFKGETRVIVYDQSTNDIIRGILKTHDFYSNEYDKIFPYFIASNIQLTCAKLFRFLKKNVPYFIESENKQYLKSPAGILQTESDCKSYALFACGVMDALRRNTGENFSVCFRFASYQLMNKNYQHVFCVVKDANENEYWIDPVLNEFNERRNPYYYEDRCIKNKAAQVGSLIAMSGIGADQTTLVLENTAEAAANTLLPGSGIVLSAAANIINQIFPSGGTQTDWQGWDGLDRQYNAGQLGTQAASHVLSILNGGDTNPNLAAQNILSWIQSKGLQQGIALICTTFHTGHDLDGQTVTFAQLLSALTKGGYGSQAQAIQQQVNQLSAPIVSSNGTSTGGGLLSGNNLLYIGIGIIALLYFYKK